EERRIAHELGGRSEAAEAERREILYHGQRESRRRKARPPAFLRELLNGPLTVRFFGSERFCQSASDFCPDVRSTFESIVHGSVRPRFAIRFSATRRVASSTSRS